MANESITTKRENAALGVRLEKVNAREKAVHALMEGLQAMTKDGSPDHRIRIQAGAEILAYTDGKPIERKEVVNVNVDSMSELQARASASPALRRSLRKLLESSPES